jgi:hypothetical protein
MPKKNRYGDHLKEWETMDAAVGANADDLPQLEAARAKLATLLDELRGLLTEQAAHRANKQQASKRLRSVSTRGRKVTSMMRAVIREFYGNTNEKLVEFGIQPRRTRSRKPVADPQPEPAKPPSPPVE